MSNIERFCIDLTIGALFVYTKWNEWMKQCKWCLFLFYECILFGTIFLPNKVSLTANVFTYNT